MLKAVTASPWSPYLLTNVLAVVGWVGWLPPQKSNERSGMRTGDRRKTYKRCGVGESLSLSLPNDIKNEAVGMSPVSWKHARFVRMALEPHGSADGFDGHKR